MSDFHPQSDPSENSRDGMAHELSDVKTGGLFLFLVGLVAVTVGVMIILGLGMGVFRRVEKKDEALRPALFQDSEGQFPQPRSQDRPREDWSRFREAERKITDTYGWVDGKAGIARIPVDRAIEILAEQGLPKGRNTPPRGARTRDQK